MKRRKTVFLLFAAVLSAVLVSCAPRYETNVEIGHEHSFVPFIESYDERNTDYIEGDEPFLDGIVFALECGECGCVLPLTDEEVWCTGEPLGRGDTSLTLHCREYSAELPVTVKRVWRVAFAGDSLTAGMGDRRDMQYSTFVKKTLRREVEVGNFGVSGISVTGYGGSFGDSEKRYEKQEVFANCCAFEPDILFITLGTNDAMGWDKASASFADDYRALVSAFREALPDCEIVIVTTPPTGEGNAFSVPNDVITDSVVPAEKALADECGLTLLDANAIISSREGGYDEIYADGVHFNEVGVPYAAEIYTAKLREITGAGK